MNQDNLRLVAQNRLEPKLSLPYHIGLVANDLANGARDNKRKEDSITDNRKLQLIDLTYLPFSLRARYLPTEAQCHIPDPIILFGKSFAE